MCKKLIVLLLVVAGLSMPASASYMGTLDNPLKVDIMGDGGGPTLTNGWQEWAFARSPTPPSTKTFVNPLYEFTEEIPVAELTVYAKNNTAASRSLSRNRSGGFTGVGNTGDYSAAGMGLGNNYIKLTIANLNYETEYTFLMWSMEASNVWSMDLANNPHSKFGVWSTTNPKDWLDTNGRSGNGGEPNGYGPKRSLDNPAATTDSNMPAGLAALVAAHGGRLNLEAADGNSLLGKFVPQMTSFKATTNDAGVIVLYGWIDPTDWTGSMHMPLQGFMVVPEPMTIALLGLGGLALIRRKRA